MDELKLLVEVVANLPTLTLWVLAGYLVYNLAVVGSIYGLIKFIVLHLYKWLVRSDVDVMYRLRGHAMDKGCAAKLEAELASLMGVRSKSQVYFHDQDIQWILDAIAEKRAKDTANATAAKN